MKKRLLSIVLAACMTLSFTACMDSDSDNTSSETESSSNSLRDNVNEVKENYNSLKEDIKDGGDSIKDDLNSSPLRKVKEGIDDIKEIVSDAKEIKDALKGEKIATPIKAKKCKGENYEKVEEEFEDAGFTEIKTKGNGKLKVGLLHGEGDVESVTINGNDSFDKGDKYPADAKVVITYYSK